MYNSTYNLFSILYTTKSCVFTLNAAVCLLKGIREIYEKDLPSFVCQFLGTVTDSCWLMKTSLAL